MLKKSIRSRHRITGVVLLLGMAMVLLSGCFGTPEQPSFDALFSATPTLTPTATILWFPATATPELEIVSTGTSSPAGQPAYSGLIFSDIGTAGEQWANSVESAGSITVDQDSVNLAVNSSKGALTAFRKNTLLYNFYFETMMTTSLCKNDDQVGVLFRVTGSMSYYRFLVSCSGQISLQQVVGGTPTALKDWMSTNQVQQGLNGSVRIGVWAYGNTLRIYLNDQLQMEVTNSTFYSGGIGFFAKASGDTSVAVNFSEIKVYQADK